MKFEFTREQADVLVSGLDALLRTQGIQVVQAVFEVNKALQDQAKTQLTAENKEPDQ